MLLHRSSSHWQGVLFVGVSTLFFGAQPIFARLAYDAGASPITVLFLRFVIAATCMLLLMFSQGIRFPQGRILLGLVLMGAGGYVLESLAYFTALTLASAGLVALLFYLYPAIVMVLTAVFLKEPITKNKIAAIVLAVIGAAFTIELDEGGHPLGIVLSLTSALLYSLYLVAGSKILKKVAAVPSSTIILTSAAVVFSGLVAVQGPQLPTTMSGWLAVGALAISTVLAVVLLLAGLERISPTNASTLSTLEPVVTVILAALVLGEIITPLQAMGGMLILCAVIVSAKSSFTAEDQVNKA